MTTIELLIVLVIAAILAVFALVAYNPGPAVARYQAEGLGHSIRHMQELAMTWGKQLRLTVAAGSYSVACVTAGAAPCNVSPVVDPATGASFSVTAQSGVTLAVSSPGGLDFAVDELGRPMNCNPSCALLSVNAQFTAASGGTTWTVQVAPVSGFVTVF
jgi:type II secretory pathway pseudopilin PulG